MCYSVLGKFPRSEASHLKSLKFLRPQFISICTPHPLWKSAGHCPIKVAMATVQALLLSGRYRCGSLLRHWSQESGVCKLSSQCSETVEDVPHFLHWCPSLANVRSGLYEYTLRYTSNLPISFMNLICRKCHVSNPTFVNFILDCSTDPDVIRASQENSPDVLDLIFGVTRIWAYVLHRERLRMLRQWRPIAYC